VGPVREEKERARAGERFLYFVCQKAIRIQLIALAVLILMYGTPLSYLLQLHILPSPSPTQYEQFFLEVSETLETVSRLLEADFWPVEGSLVGILRYGATNGDLGEGKFDMVDDDIDFMVGVKTETDWIVLVPRLLASLTSKGWADCVLSSTEQHLESRRMDRLRCFKGGLLSRFLIKVDLHSCIVMKEDGVAFNHKWVDKETGQLSYGGYPFEAWGGLLPLNLIYPLNRCKCYNRVLSCPNKPVALLKKWNNYEYDRAGCLALPLARTTRREQIAIMEHSKRLNDEGFASFLEEFKHPLCIQKILVANVSEGLMPTGL